MAGGKEAMAAAGGGLLMAVTGGLAAWTQGCSSIRSRYQEPGVLTTKTLFLVLLCRTHGLWDSYFGNCGQLSGQRGRP